MSEQEKLVKEVKPKFVVVNPDAQPTEEALDTMALFIARWAVERVRAREAKIAC